MESTVEKTGIMQKNKNLKMLIIAVLIGIVLKLILPVSEGGLTSSGATFLAIFVPLVICWSTVGTGWPSFFAVSAVVLFGLWDSNSMFSLYWGNYLTAIIIPLCMISHVMNKSGFSAYVAKWFLSRKLVHGRPIVFYLMIAVTVWVLSLAIPPVIVAVVLVELLGTIALSCGYSKDSTFYRSMFMILMFILAPCEVALPFGRVGPLTIMAMLSEAGITSVNIITWMAFVWPFIIVAGIIGIIVIVFIYRPDLSLFNNFDDAGMRAELKSQKLPRSAFLSIGAIGVVIAIFVIQFLNFGAVTEFFKAWGMCIGSVLCAAILCIIPDNDGSGKPIMNFDEALQSVPWSMLAFFGAILYFASYMGSPDFGITATMVNVFSPVMSGLPAIVIILVVVVMGAIMTQYMSNTVTTVLLVTVVLTLFLNMGASTALICAVCCGIGLACNLAMCAYSGSPAIGMIYSERSIPLDGQILKYSWITVAIDAVLLIPMIYILQVIF